MTNLLAVTASGLCTTLLFITGVLAASSAEAIDPTTSVTETNNSQQPIVLQNKKQIRQKNARKTTKTTARIAPANPVRELAQVPPPPPAPDDSTTPSTPEPAKPATLDPFSMTTKLEGEVIFGVTGAVGGDYSRNTVFGDRIRLNLLTNIGAGVLTTRLQAAGLGLATQNPTKSNISATPEGALSFSDGTTSNTVGIDLLKYEFPIDSQTQMVIAANNAVADDFTDTINPYFDGDGTSGALSFFGTRNPLYYTVQGAGVGVRHKLNDNAELSLGYLARTASSPTAGNGLFGGGYGGIAQLTLKTGENSKVGITYTRSFNSEPGSGSTNANEVYGNGASNNFGVQGSVLMSPQFALGGWVGYTQNQANGLDRQIWNWAVTASAPDLGGKGNLAGILVGQEPRVTFASDGSADTKAGLHIEGFYQFKVSENLSITPGLIYLTAPNQDANSSGATIGVVRTTYVF